MRISTLLSTLAIACLATSSPVLRRSRSIRRACKAKGSKSSISLASAQASSPTSLASSSAISTTTTIPIGNTLIVNPTGTSSSITINDIAISSSISSVIAEPTQSSISTPSTGVNSPTPRSDKHVFAHFMVGIVSTYDLKAWEYDMNLAKSYGITGFALNIGNDPYNEAQLDFAYQAAENIGEFDLFISFDFNWFKLTDGDRIVKLMKRYSDKKNQLYVDGKVFVSTFIGDGFDWDQVAKGIGKELYSVPFYQPKPEYAAAQDLAGLFSWAAWPGQLDNQPIKQNMTMDRDLTYLTQVESSGKTYMAPISPWFSTHFGKEVSYSKNWVFYSEMLWKTRWDQILEMGDKLNFIEIVTWNDYGESHHVGPFNTPHTDDGSSKWTEGTDHLPMLEMAKPYISAFKAGLNKPDIQEDMLVYWYRPHLKSAQCDTTDNCGSKPTGWEMLDDSVFVTVLSKTGGTVTVTSGSNEPFIKKVEAGSQGFSVPMGVGKQNFKFEPTSGGSKQDVSTVDISDQCWKGIYNYNFHSGIIKM